MSDELTTGITELLHPEQELRRPIWNDSPYTDTDRLDWLIEQERSLQYPFIADLGPYWLVRLGKHGEFRRWTGKTPRAAIDAAMEGSR